MAEHGPRISNVLRERNMVKCQTTASVDQPEVTECEGKYEAKSKSTRSGTT
jgi:hypothetical protein